MSPAMSAAAANNKAKRPANGKPKQRYSATGDSVRIVKHAIIRDKLMYMVQRLHSPGRWMLAANVPRALIDGYLSDADQLYTVERIVSHRVCADGRTTYGIRWVGHSEITWEPEELLNATLVENYRFEHGLDEPLYEVERIVGKRLLDGCVQYRVRWLHCAPDEDTWEPEEQLFCDRKVREFERDQKTGTAATKRKSSDAMVTTPMKRRATICGRPTVVSPVPERTRKTPARRASVARPPTTKRNGNATANAVNLNVATPQRRNAAKTPTKRRSKSAGSYRTKSKSATKSRPASSSSGRKSAKRRPKTKCSSVEKDTDDTLDMVGDSDDCDSDDDAWAIGPDAICGQAPDNESVADESVSGDDVDAMIGAVPQEIFCRLVRKDGEMFYVKWSGLSSKYNSWVPADQLPEPMLAQFKRMCTLNCTDEANGEERPGETNKVAGGHLIWEKVMHGNYDGSGTQVPNGKSNALDTSDQSAKEQAVMQSPIVIVDDGSSEDDTDALLAVKTEPVTDDEPKSDDDIYPIDVDESEESSVESQNRENESDIDEPKTDDDIYPIDVDESEESSVESQNRENDTDIDDEPITDDIVPIEVNDSEESSVETPNSENDTDIDDEPVTDDIVPIDIEESEGSSVGSPNRENDPVIDDEPITDDAIVPIAQKGSEEFPVERPNLDNYIIIDDETVEIASPVSIVRNESVESSVERSKHDNNPVTDRVADDDLEVSSVEDNYIIIDDETVELAGPVLDDRKESDEISAERLTRENNRAKDDEPVALVGPVLVAREESHEKSAERLTCDNDLAMDDEPVALIGPVLVAREESHEKSAEEVPVINAEPVIDIAPVPIDRDESDQSSVKRPKSVAAVTLSYLNACVLNATQNLAQTSQPAWRFGQVPVRCALNPAFPASASPPVCRAPVLVWPASVPHSSVPEPDAARNETAAGNEAMAIAPENRESAGNDPQNANEELNSVHPLVETFAEHPNGVPDAAPHSSLTNANKQSMHSVQDDDDSNDIVLIAPPTSPAGDQDEYDESSIGILNREIDEPITEDAPVPIGRNEPVPSSVDRPMPEPVQPADAGNHLPDNREPGQPDPAPPAPANQLPANQEPAQPDPPLPVPDNQLPANPEPAQPPANPRARVQVVSFGELPVLHLPVANGADIPPPPVAARNTFHLANRTSRTYSRFQRNVRSPQSNRRLPYTAYATRSYNTEYHALEAGVPFLFHNTRVRPINQIIDVRHDGTNCYYLVDWMRGVHESRTWELEQNVHAPGLIRQFLQQRFKLGSKEQRRHLQGAC